jgi:hypothetical protein
MTIHEITLTSTNHTLASIWIDVEANSSELLKGTGVTSKIVLDLLRAKCLFIFPAS